MTPKEAKRALDITLCACGCEKWDHDFGFGGNEKTGCLAFTPAEPEKFEKLVKIFHDGNDLFSPSSFVSRDLTLNGNSR